MKAHVVTEFVIHYTTDAFLDDVYPDDFKHFMNVLGVDVYNAFGDDDSLIEIDATGRMLSELREDVILGKYDKELNELFYDKDYPIVIKREMVANLFKEICKFGNTLDGVFRVHWF